MLKRAALFVLDLPGAVNAAFNDSDMALPVFLIVGICLMLGVCVTGIVAAIIQTGLR